MPEKPTVVKFDKYQKLCIITDTLKEDIIVRDGKLIKLYKKGKNEKRVFAVRLYDIYRIVIEERTVSRFSGDDDGGYYTYDA